MGILSDFEDRVAAGIEGLFAGAFRSPVQPVELATALGKAMDDGRAVGVDRVYAPLAYTVALSAEDNDKLDAFEDTLAGELETYLVDHARELHYELGGRPSVGFVVHDDLRLGRFRVSAALASPHAAPPAGAATSVPVPVPRPPTAAPAQPIVAPVNPAVSELATVTLEGVEHDVALRGDQVVVGRLADCQIQLADANISRRHAAFVRLEDGWAIEDLESTNGTRLNGSPVTRARLHDGDVVEMGVSRLVFHEPRRG